MVVVEYANTLEGSDLLYTLHYARFFRGGQAQKVAVCDAQTKDRVGPAVELLEQAESVHVFDHHVDRDSDIVDAVLHIDQ